MKKVILSALLNANDNFKEGDCENCPIVVKRWEESSYNCGAYKYICPIKYSPINCPMEIVFKPSNKSLKTDFDDTVSVVRCKDCVHYHKKGESQFYDDDICDLLYEADETHRVMCEQDYCSYGRRKED